MRKKLVLCNIELETLYVDESIQDQFDLFVVTLKMMGMNVEVTSKINNDGERDSFEIAVIAFSNSGDLVVTSMFGNVEVYSFKGDIDYMDAEIYSGSKGKMKYRYRAIEDELEKVNEMLKKILLYIE